MIYHDLVICTIFIFLSFWLILINIQHYHPSFSKKNIYKKYGKRIEFHQNVTYLMCLYLPRYIALHCLLCCSCSTSCFRDFARVSCMSDFTRIPGMEFWIFLNYAIWKKYWTCYHSSFSSPFVTRDHYYQYICWNIKIFVAIIIIVTTATTIIVSFRFALLGISVLLLLVTCDGGHGPTYFTRK